MLNIEQFTNGVIIPALESIDRDSVAARELLLGTALQESGLRYLKQLGFGPALGLFQMEPTTHDDIWENFLVYRQGLQRATLLSTLYKGNVAEEMVWNLRYAAVMCRIHYLRVPKPLPEAGDLEGQARYWKKYYNTHLGKGKEKHYIEKWKLAHL